MLRVVLSGSGWFHTDDTNCQYSQYLGVTYYGYPASTGRACIGSACTGSPCTARRRRDKILSTTPGILGVWSIEASSVHRFDKFINTFSKKTHKDRCSWEWHQDQIAFWGTTLEVLIITAPGNYYVLSTGFVLMPRHAC